MSQTEEETLQRICEEVQGEMGVSLQGAVFTDFAKAVARRYAETVGAGRLAEVNADALQQIRDINEGASQGVWHADAYSPVTGYGDVACEVLCDDQSIATFAGGGELQPHLALPLEKTGENNARLAVACVNFMRRLLATPTA